MGLIGIKWKVKKWSGAHLGRSRGNCILWNTEIPDLIYSAFWMRIIRYSPYSHAEWFALANVNASLPRFSRNVSIRRAPVACRRFGRDADFSRKNAAFFAPEYLLKNNIHDLRDTQPVAELARHSCSFF
jgi:hypothetical protein